MATRGSPATEPPGPSPVSQVAPAGLTLDEAVRLAVAASPGRRAVQERAQAWRESASDAGAFPNPSLDVRTENWQPGGRAPGDPLNDTFVVLTQPLELSGKAGARRRVAEAEAAALATGVKATTRQLTLEVAHYFLGAAGARGRLELLDVQRESTREVVTILGRRVTEGVTAEADLRKVEADLARLDIEATRAQVDLQTNLSWLGALLGREAPVQPEELVVPRADAVLAPVGDAVENVPEVTAARQRAIVADAAADLARRDRWPELLVSGGYKRTAGVNTAVAGVSVALPLFDHRARAVTLGEAERNAASHEAEDAARRARADAVARVAEARLLSERAARVDRDVLVPAEIAWRAARTSFREGAGDVLRLLDAERVFGDARREALNLKLEAALAQVRARLALGEEWP